MIQCKSVSNDDDDDVDDVLKVMEYLTNIYEKGIYYILNDFVYFKNFLPEDKCFIQELFLHNDGNINLLQNIPLLSKQEFNDTYLSEKNDKTIELITKKEKYLETIYSNNYTYYDGKNITKEIVDDILGYLYESERYNLYLYLIDDTMPLEGKKILVKLYSMLVQKNSLTTDTIISSLNETSKRVVNEPNNDQTSLSNTLKELPQIKGIKGIEEKKQGPEHLLKAVDYVKQKSNTDGNCFYNSIGMLSSSYMVMKEQYDKYVNMDFKKQYDTQFKEQTRVRTELTKFLIKIYELIKGSIDKTSDIYKNSHILKYIMINGNKGFKYVAKIASSVGSDYYGSDDEIFFASLFYLQPIVTITGISTVTHYNIFYWDSYTIDGVIFKDYINRQSIDVNKVINFLAKNNTQDVYGIDMTSMFLLRYPTSYFLVGGRGHWSYAANSSLLQEGSADDGSDQEEEGQEFGGGGPDKKVTTYNLKFTKKIKNKYYKKGSLPSSSKTTKKHKKTRKANRNKDNKDNKDNKHNILKNKKRIKKTIKL